MPAEIYEIQEPEEEQLDFTEKALDTPESITTEATREIATLPAQSLKGKAIISIANGKKLGEVAEVLFDPHSLRVASLMSTSGGLLSRRTQAVPASDVSVWGIDVILVKSPQLLQMDDMSGRDEWAKLSEDLSGRYVVSTDGVRIGQVSDVLIDQNGKVTGYSLSQVFVEGPIKQSQVIPVAATSSLGKDVLIVDRNKL